MPSATPTVGAPVPGPAPDDLDYRHRGSRVHVAEHQRGADATAIGRLAVQVPGFLVSLALVSSIALGMFDDLVGTVVLLAWLASGLLVFHRPAELAFARFVLKLRLPTPEERARLEPVWHEVTARAGIEPHTYELMVENSDELNAVAVAGHVVGVTTYSLDRIPSSNLAAVLAHELGPHTGGHAWAGLLGHWYSLPGRAAWATSSPMRAGAVSCAPTSRPPSSASPVSRPRSCTTSRPKRPRRRRPPSHGDRSSRSPEPGALARLLSAHPDHRTRLSALGPYPGLNR
ncbi:M48 family metalloprotease [Streptomyces sp. NPDC007264]|uniref:M48 family metalloprotease n=1 Tax=Streptomyces sp. NPDC007264 TaxID=3364777 RepID=UPI0036D81722